MAEKFTIVNILAENGQKEAKNGQNRFTVVNIGVFLFIYRSFSYLIIIKYARILIYI